jgi:hypothetical protein
MLCYFDLMISRKIDVHIQLISLSERDIHCKKDKTLTKQVTVYFIIHPKSTDNSSQQREGTGIDPSQPTTKTALPLPSQLDPAARGCYSTS